MRVSLTVWQPHAHNPLVCSCPTLHLCADGMPCYTAAEEVVLVELASGQVQHAPTARVVLEQIAPQARLTVLQAEWAPEAAADSKAS